MIEKQTINCLDAIFYSLFIYLIVTKKNYNMNRFKTLYIFVKNDKKWFLV